ncbi:MAG: hypothetical protein ACQXXH_07070 [Candidatus Bathyarchaeia archaeon]|nr:hypothetical protein [Candidatus Bathyarchaeota archaeon A05DMB-4]MDH7595739.1 hypothetical protein [Candidatus Bathyarchaeota archaeon]
MAANGVTWKKPRSIVIILAWGVLNASLVMLAFLGGRLPLEWFDWLLLFFVAVFAGALLAEMKTIVLGAFEALLVSVGLTYLFMVLPVIVGNVEGYYFSNVVYSLSVTRVFWEFFPVPAFMCLLGGVVGGFVEDFIF